PTIPARCRPEHRNQARRLRPITNIASDPIEHITPQGGETFHRPGSDMVPVQDVAARHLQHDPRPDQAHKHPTHTTHRTAPTDLVHPREIHRRRRTRQRHQHHAIQTRNHTRDRATHIHRRPPAVKSHNTATTAEYYRSCNILQHRLERPATQTTGRRC